MNVLSEIQACRNTYLQLSFFVERLVFNDYQSFLSLGMENTSPNVTCEAKNQKRGGNIVRGHHKKIR